MTIQTNTTIVEEVLKRHMPQVPEPLVNIVTQPLGEDDIRFIGGTAAFVQEERAYAGFLAIYTDHMAVRVDLSGTSGKPLVSVHAVPRRALISVTLISEQDAYFDRILDPGEVPGGVLISARYQGLEGPILITSGHAAYTARSEVRELLAGLYADLRA